LKILIAYASKKGATQDMAARIARGLGNADLVEMSNARAGAVDLSGYGLVVIGSIMKTSGDSSTIDQHAVDDFIATLAALA